MAEVVVLRKEKETKNFVKYSAEGRVIAAVYLPKDLANGKEQLTATIE